MAADPDGNNADARRRARLERFNNALPGNRYKELEALRIKQRDEYIEKGLLTSGQTDLGAAVDLRGTCEGMCNEYEIEFREYTKEIHPFEATPNRRMDHAKAVAAYTRSDAGAGHGAAAILPSDLRTPQALVRTLDYLISQILPMQPPPNPNAVNPPTPTARRALGYSAGFIRDRTRSIRKEFAIQSSWGHEEAIACFERIARWHILCLRELQEETGSNTDMHIDSAELGRALVSLRQHYNDRREESGLDMPCANEPEFRAYMLIFDLNSKSVAIPISELPSVILDHPLVKLAWQFRQAAQRNFDSQKEGSKLNAELGANLINRFVRLLKQPNVPFLFSCLMEIRLREMRRSAIRSLTRAYPRLRQGPVRLDDNGQILERRMMLLPVLDKIIGAEEQEDEEPAWDDVEPVSKSPDAESVAVSERFNLEVYYEQGQPMGTLINHASPYNDNKDAPFTRRWKFITEKRGQTPYGDVVNGKSGVALDGMGAAAPATPSVWKPPAVVKPPQPVATTFAPPRVQPTTNGSAFGGGSAFSGKSAFGSAPTTGASAFGPPPADVSAFSQPKTTTSAFSGGTNGSAFSTSAFTSAKPTPTPTPPPASTPPAPGLAAPSFFDASKAAIPPVSTTPKQPPPIFPSLKAETKTPEPKRKSFFDAPAEAGPSKLPSTTPAAPPPSMPSFFPSAPAATPVKPPTFSIPTIVPTKPPSPKAPSPPRPPPEPPKMKVSRELMRKVPALLRDQLIAEVIDSMIAAAKPHFTAIINQHEEAQNYVRAKETREREIKRFARLAADRLIAEHIESIARGVFEREERIRTVVRECALHWRTRAAQAAEDRAERERQKRVNAALLKGMGLSRSVAAFDRTQGTQGFSQSSRRMSTVSRTSMATMHKPDEMDVLLELVETQQTQSRLWENSSFLQAIAMHIARVVRPTSDDPTPVWETVLLAAEHSGSGVPSQARSWLADKFLPSRGATLAHGNVTFKSSVEDVRGDIPGSSDTGLVVFEAPLETINSTERVLNIDDASDRLEAISGRFQQGSRYRPALLLITWTDEPLDELVDRLNILESLSEFDRIQVLSLEDADSLDERFAHAVRQLVPSDPRMTQVVLHLSDVVSRIEPRWRDLLHLAQQIQTQFPDSAPLVSDIMKNALTPLYRLPEAIDNVVYDLPVTEYDPPPLPPLIIPPSENDNLTSVATAIAEFLAEPAFAHVAQVALVRGPVRQSAANGRPLPIIDVLQTIGSYMFDPLTTQSLRVEQWLLPADSTDAAANLVDKIVASMEKDFTAAAQGIAGAGREIELATASVTPLPDTPDSVSSWATPKPMNKGTKRTHDDATPPTTKAAKNARLLRVLADVQATLNQIDQRDAETSLLLM